MAPPPGLIGLTKRNTSSATNQPVSTVGTHATPPGIHEPDAGSQSPDSPISPVTTQLPDYPVSPPTPQACTSPDSPVSPPTPQPSTSQVNPATNQLAGRPVRNKIQKYDPSEWDLSSIKSTITMNEALNMIRSIVDKVQGPQ